MNGRLACSLLLSGLIMAMAGACQQPGPGAYPVAPTYYYVVPTTTYLRSCPSYGEECPVVATVFNGDRVLVLDRNQENWARVQLDRTGVVGWLPGGLLSASPIPTRFYVAWTSVYLRDCADYNCRGVALLHRGARVDKIDQDYRGWWRVKVLKSGISGWLPAAAMAPSPGPPYFYVAVSSLALRSGPTTSSRVLTTLSRNDRVEELGWSTGGWAQVRDFRSNTIGWVAFRYLETFPVRAVPKKRTPAPKEKAAPSEEKPAPAPAPPAAPAKPSIM